MPDDAGEDEPTVELPPLDVEGTAPAVRPQGLVADHDADELARRGARTAADALALDPAAAVRSGPRGDRPFVVRGFDQREVALTVEGLPFELPYDGNADLAGFPASWIAALRVEKGPESLAAAPTGLGAAVRLTLREPGRGPLLDAAAEMTPTAGARVDAFHSGHAGPAAWLVGGGIERTAWWLLPAGFPDERHEDGARRESSDRALQHVLARAAFALAPGHRLGLTAGFVDGAWGVPPSTFQPQARYWRFASWRSGLLLATYEGRLHRTVALDAAVSGVGFANVLDSYDDDTYATQDTGVGWHSTFLDRGVGASLRLRLGPWDLPLGALSAAARTSVRFDHHRGVSDRGADATVASGVDIEGAGELRWALGDVLELAGSASVTGDVPVETGGPTPPAAVGWGGLLEVRGRPHPRVTLEAGAGHTIRFATLKERYSEALGARAAAPELGPESAWTFRAGVAWRPIAWLSLSAAGFDSEVAGFIEPVAVDVGVQQLRNVGRARIAGTEVGVALGPLAGVELALGYAWLHAQREDEAGEAVALYHRPAHRATGAALWRPFAALDVGVAVEVVGAARSTDTFGQHDTELDAYARLDASVAFRVVPEVELSLRVSNALDARYESAWGFPEPGRTLWLGVRLRVPE